MNLLANHIYIYIYIYGGGGLVVKSSPILVTPWTVALQTPLSMGFSRQEYWSGLPFPFLGYLPDPGVEPRSPALQGDSLPTEPSRQFKYTYTYLALSVSLVTLIHCTGVFIKIVCTWLLTYTYYNI